MRALIVVGFFIFWAGAGYFFSPLGNDIREVLWMDFDKDNIILDDGASINGWIWTETEEAVMGEKENADVFTLKRDIINKIEYNKLFCQLKNIL